MLEIIFYFNNNFYNNFKKNIDKLKEFLQEEKFNVIEIYNKDELTSVLSKEPPFLIISDAIRHNERIWDVVSQINSQTKILILDFVSKLENGDISSSILAYLPIYFPVDVIYKYINQQKRFLITKNILQFDPNDFFELKNNRYVRADESTKKMYDRALKVGSKEGHVLIFGESGTGKYILANYIHSNSQFRKNNLVQLNCADLVYENTASQILFGYKKGAFQGATDYKLGIIQKEMYTTIYLNNLETLNKNTQALLIRTLESGEFSLVGDEGKIQKANIRIIASSSEPFDSLISSGKLRKDFYNRFKMEFSIYPLRKRPNDTRNLIEKRIQEKENNLNKPIRIDQEVLLKLNKIQWQHNFWGLNKCMDQLLEIAESNFEITIDNSKEIFNQIY
jgi:DNA-binding NtrC family response regulator